MGEKIINVAAVDGKSFRIPILEGTTVEEVVIIICQRYEIKPVLRHLFAFRFDNQHWCALNSHLWHFSYTNFEFRIRYRVPNLSILLEKDVKAFDYYFFQVRDDILKSRIGDIRYLYNLMVFVLRFVITNRYYFLRKNCQLPLIFLLF